MYQELLTLPEHLSSPPVFSGVRVTRFLVLYVCFVCPFELFLFDIVLSVLFRYTDSDHPFGIFKLFLHNHTELTRLYDAQFHSINIQKVKCFNMVKVFLGVYIKSVIKLIVF